MFTPIVMAFKMPEIATFLYFLFITKTLSQFGQYIQIRMEDNIEPNTTF